MVLCRACPRELHVAGVDKACCLLLYLLLSLPKLQSVCLSGQVEPLHLWDCRSGRHRVTTI